LIVKDWLIRKFHPLLDVSLELTNDCNMKPRCWYCYSNKRGIGYMDSDFAKHVIDQLPHHVRLGLGFGGESGLHPRFKEIAEYAADHGFRDINVYSNGLQPELYEDAPIRVVVGKKPPGIIYPSDLSIPKQYNLPETNRYCKDLYRGLVILWDGRVTVCCADLAGIMCVGNLGVVSVKDVWNGSKYRELREFGHCLKCQVYRVRQDMI